MKQIKPQQDQALEVLLQLIDIAQKAAGLAQTENCLYWAREIKAAVEIVDEKDAAWLANKEKQKKLGKKTGP